MRRVIIFGAGYVGLTLGVVSAKVGYDVLFVDINPEIVSSLNNRVATFYENGLQDSLANYFNDKNEIAFLSLSDLYDIYENIPCIYIISLGTPLDDNYKALLKPIENVLIEIIKWKNSDDLVILRSTVTVGTSRYLVNTFDNLKTISFCPERTVEGKALEELSYLPQIVSGNNLEAINLASDFFKKITPDILCAESLETAELVKLASNAFRDLNFAYSNFLALISNKFGVNVYELIKLANFRYERNLIALPGLVGGPCLQKDSYILSDSYLKSDSNFVLKARKFNEEMLVNAIEFLSYVNPNKDISILICGAAFKGRPLTNDLRGSFVFKLVDNLVNIGINLNNINIIDPLVTSIGCNVMIYNHINLIEKKYDFLIQLTDHEIFYSNEFDLFVENSVDHVISFWPCKPHKLNDPNSLYLGGKL